MPYQQPSAGSNGGDLRKKKIAVSTFVLALNQLANANLRDKWRALHLSTRNVRWDSERGQRTTFNTN